MSWKMRHEGSPQAVAGLTLEEILHGLADGNWEPTDEVMGPNDKTWRKLEEHPQFAELAAELEPPPPRQYGDEDAHVDMNALIDVCMVLLIFFILTTSYAALQSKLKSPEGPPEDENQVQKVRLMPDKEQEQAVHVVVRLVDGKPVIQVEGNRVALADVEAELKKIVRGSKKSTLLLEVDPKIKVGVPLVIQREAAAAGMKDIKRVMPAGS